MQHAIAIPQFVAHGKLRFQPVQCDMGDRQAKQLPKGRLHQRDALHQRLGRM
jgi:hypothetical protein